jgi:hypothetical protein
LSSIVGFKSKQAPQQKSGALCFGCEIHQLVKISAEKPDMPLFYLFVQLNFTQKRQLGHDTKPVKK